MTSLPRPLFPVACATALAAAPLAPAGLVDAGTPAGAARPSHAHHAGAPMSDAEMERLVDAWYATHPRVGAHPAAAGFPVATFIASGTTFDADGIGGDVDTAFIMTGETVRWQRTAGIHTTTSGESSLDPNVGLIFDQPLNSASPIYDHTFTSSGIVPFFCSPHEGFGMKGVVVVSDPVGVPPLPGGQGIGFAAGPWPNPSPGGMRFHFALATQGRVRADIVDARGRFVATLVDRVFPAGTHGAAWDGHSVSGQRATAGTYFVRLHLPGFTGGRSFVLRR